MTDFMKGRYFNLIKLYSQRISQKPKRSKFLAIDFIQKAC